MGVFHVKQSPSQLRTLIENEIQRIGISASSTSIQSLADLITWIAPSAHRLGLTKYSDPSQLATQLVLPPLQLLSTHLLPLIQSPVLDFGAGCGAVGLSLAVLAPELQFVLADRRSRVIQFVDVAIQRHGLKCAEALQVDLSDPSAAYERSFGTVLVRAYGPPSEALSQAERWLRPGGHVAFWHQPPPSSAPDGLIRTRSEPTNLPDLVLTAYMKQ